MSSHKTNTSNQSELLKEPNLGSQSMPNLRDFFSDGSSSLYVPSPNPPHAPLLRATLSLPDFSRMENDNMNEK